MGPYSIVSYRMTTLGMHPTLYQSRVVWLPQRGIVGNIHAVDTVPRVERAYNSKDIIIQRVLLYPFLFFPFFYQSNFQLFNHVDSGKSIRRLVAKSA